METISILIPTRGRPDNILRVIDSAIETAANEHLLEFVFYVDRDDQPSINQLLYLQQKQLAGLIEFVCGPRIVLSQMWNECCLNSRGNILMHGGDDIVFQTRGWDNMVRAEFEKSKDGIVFVYGRDGLQPDSFGTHGFISRRAVEAVGYFVPPYFSSDYNDTWWNEVYEMIGRRRFIEIMTEHMHPEAGKGEWDTTHLERKERHNRDNVAQIYADKHSERVADADKLSAAIENFHRFNS